MESQKSIKVSRAVELAASMRNKIVIVRRRIDGVLGIVVPVGEYNSDVNAKQDFSFIVFGEAFSFMNTFGCYSNKTWEEMLELMNSVQLKVAFDYFIVESFQVERAITDICRGMQKMTDIPWKVPVKGEIVICTYKFGDSIKTTLAQRTISDRWNNWSERNCWTTANAFQLETWRDCDVVSWKHVNLEA